MKYTIGTAAKATGKAKSTISRDVKAGTISAEKTKTGRIRLTRPSCTEFTRLWWTTTVHKTPNRTIRNSKIRQLEQGCCRLKLNGCVNGWKWPTSKGTGSAASSPTRLQTFERALMQRVRSAAN